MVCQQTGTTTLENWQYLLKLNTYISYDSAILLLQYLHTHHAHTQIYQTKFRTYGCQGGRMGEDMHTAMFKMDNQQGPTVCSTGSSAQCYVAAWMGAESGGEWIHVYVWLNPFAIHLKLSTLLIRYTPI